MYLMEIYMGIYMEGNRAELYCNVFLLLLQYTIEIHFCNIRYHVIPKKLWRVSNGIISNCAGANFYWSWP